MNELTRRTYKNISRLSGEGVYQLFGHFVVTSLILFIGFVLLGLVTGALLLAMAFGSFIWALFAVACVKYCELTADPRREVQS